MRFIQAALLTLLAVTFTACSTMSTPLRPVPSVDLPKFMGDWYVYANIPYFAEKDCVGSVESYRLLPNGTVDTVFTARKPDFDGKEVRVRTLGIIKNKETNAEWQVQPIWPIRVAYIVTDLDPEYQWAVISHPSRNYAWVLSRTPTLSDTVYSGILERLGGQGYDPKRLQKVPQKAAAPTFPVGQPKS